jgi:putative addiction module component (TIGR02574 family)
MSATLTEIAQKATQLPAEERAHLAMFLIQSLDPSDEGDVENAWLLEAEARLAQIEKGEARLVPSAEVFANIRQRLLA